jgi:hypothetical protein
MNHAAIRAMLMLMGAQVVTMPDGYAIVARHSGGATMQAWARPQLGWQWKYIHDYQFTVFDDRTDLHDVTMIPDSMLETMDISTFAQFMEAVAWHQGQSIQAVDLSRYSK